MSEQVIELTPIAIEKIAAARNEEGLGPDQGLRVGVRKGGCSGYEYSLKFAPQPSDGDVILESGGVRVFIAADSVDLLRGTVLDYVDGLAGAGLRFVNPNAQHECGCGASFSAAPDSTSPR